jgi:DNA-directed RNA polymerase subunit RPC12/RpoP
LALLEYKCPNCGGAIQFDAGAQEMVCPYCDSVMDVEALRSMDEQLARDQQSESIDWGYEGNGWLEGEQQGMAVYSCKSCGGEIVGDETLGATTCPFCGNQVVMTSKFAGTLRPDVVIPFKQSKDDALRSLEKHYLGKRLLPSVFKEKNHLDEIKGVYVPFWLYDADVEAHIEYSATKVRNWSDKNYNYTETSTYRVYREGGLGFDQVPADGSKAIDDTLMESIEPFDMKDAVDFRTAYLAGYFANKYDVGADENAPRVSERITNSTIATFRNTVTGYNTVTPVSSDVRMKNGGVRYALLPVWLLSTSWQGQNFLFAMNGQTGKFVGDLPLDKAAYRSWFIKIFGAVAAVLLVATQIYVFLR